MQYFCTSIELQIDTPFSSVLETQDYQGMLDRLLIVLQNIDHPLLIVVDDFHYITNQAVYNLLVYFLRYKTNNIQVVFSGRSSLPLSFEPLLLNHKIVLVDEDALRFSADEIKEFLSKKNFLVNEDQVKLLSRKTDGWALALVALSLTMNKVVDTAQIHNFKGARYIENFLLQEVWAKWDENTRKFLMLTSVLDEFSLPLAVEMTGMEHSRDILKKLQDHQAFIVTLDHDETLYRYHHVFRDFLATMLSRDEQFSAQKQNRLAANYYRKSKNTSKAVPYYLKANDFDGLMALIEENCSDFLLSDEAEKLVALVESLEPYGAFDRLRICVCYAYALHNTKQVIRTEAFIRELKLKYEAQKESLSRKEAKLLFIEICAMSLPYAVLDFDYDLTLYYLKQLVAHHTETLVLGVSNVMSMCEREFTLRNTVFGFWGRNRFHVEFWSKLEKNKEFLLLAGVARVPALCVARSEILYELDRTDEALSQLSGNIERTKKRGDMSSYLPAMLCLANIQKSRGNVDAAYATIDTCLETLYEANAQYEAQLVSAYKSGLDLDFGKRQDVEDWEKSLQISPYDDVSEKSRLNLYLQIALGKVLIKTGRTAIAKVQLTHLAEAIEPYEDLIYKITIRCLLCILSIKERNMDQALSHLIRVLKIGQKHGYYRTIADFGQDLLPVLEFAVSRRIFETEPELTETYLNQLVQLSRAYTQATIRYKDMKPESIHLSKKEQQILSCLSQDMSHVQIADKMSFSAQTIKNYTSKIYRKLDVSGKQEALIKAKLLGIL